MGCGQSKHDETQLVRLCRERKDLVKSAIDARYALAEAHSIYVRSLSDVGESLHRFVNHGLIPVRPPNSPVLHLPSDGKKIYGKEVSSEDVSLSHGNSPVHSHLRFESDESDAESVTGPAVAQNLPEKLQFSMPAAPAGYSNPPVGYAGHSNPPAGYSGYSNPPAGYSGYSNPPAGYSGYSNPPAGYSGYSNPPAGYSGYSSPPAGYQNPPDYQYSVWNQPTMNYMRSSGIPAMVYTEQAPRSPPETVIWGDANANANWSYPEYPPPRPPENLKPPPPPPSASGWDFFDVFQNYDEMYPYSGIQNSSSSRSSPNSDEVRKMEGIPDLEDEFKALEKNVDRDVKNNGVNDGKMANGHIMVDDDNDDHDEDDESDEDDEEFDDDHIMHVNDGEKVHTKELSFGVEAGSFEEGESSKMNEMVAMMTQGTRDLQEVVGEITDHFRHASECGREVSEVLEVERLTYRRQKTALKVISSKVYNYIAMSIPASSHSVDNLQLSPTVGEDFRLVSNNLSGILEELYTWEKKLYLEVKVEEKLRLAYEKNFKRLKDLDSRGAEADKIDATQAYVKKLLTKISVSLRAIDSISSKIHKLRDVELQDQLIQLIRGLIQMWKTMLNCHRKQCQSIIESRTLDIISSRLSLEMALKSTTRLEADLLNWRTSFNNWIKAQKEYVRFLHGWLMKCIYQEQEVTPDGVAPFSPSRVGAPLAFIICNDWYATVQRISGDQVEVAILGLAESMHKLWEQQDEEQRQGLMAEYLSKNLEKQQRLLELEENRHRNQGIVNNHNVVSSPDQKAVISLEDKKMAVGALEKKLDEERLKHAELVRQVQGNTFTSLKTGLTKIFEAMVEFTSSAASAYEGLRIPNT